MKFPPTLPDNFTFFTPLVVRRKWSYLRYYYAISRTNWTPSTSHIDWQVERQSAHTIVPWDDDLDIRIRHSDRLRLESMYNSCLFVTDGIFYHGSKYLKLYARNGINSMEYEWTFPFIDVWFTYENATHVWNTSTTMRWFPRARPSTRSVVGPSVTCRRGCHATTPSIYDEGVQRNAARVMHGGTSSSVSPFIDQFRWLCVASCGRTFRLNSVLSALTTEKLSTF